MRGQVRRLGAVLCALLLCFSAGCARAEFSPAFAALLREEALTLTVDQAAFDALEPLSDASLAIVNGWLNELAARLTVRSGKDQAQLVQIAMQGVPVFAVSMQQTEEGTVTAFSLFGGAYLTADGQKDALTLLSGAEEAWDLPDPLAAYRLYAAVAPELYPLLAAYTTPRRVQDSTSVKNALSSPSYENYVFKDGELNEIWPQLLDALLPAVRGALRDWPAWQGAADAILKEAVFSGECRFKRLLDKNGGDMGLQFTGQVEAGASGKRKITLFGGFTPGRGGSFSLSLPAVSGKNTLKISFGGRLTETDSQNTLTFDGAYTRTLNGATDAAEMEGTLKNAVKGGGESWSGKITVTETKEKVKTVWTLTPDITAQNGALTGSVTVQQKVGSSIRAKARLHLTLEPAEAGTVPDTMAVALDLRLLNEASARARVLGEMAPLSRLLLRLMGKLTQEQRTLLTHELRTDGWMNGPLAPVLQTQPAAPPDDAGNGDPSPDPGDDSAADPRDDWEQWIVEEEE